MKLLLDTHLLLWAAWEPDKLSPAALDLIEDTANDLTFSSASIWEFAIKASLGRPDFSGDARVLRRALVDNGYAELAVTSDHALELGRLPPIHKDPFDRMLVAQAVAEGITLLTADPVVAAYEGPIRKV